MEVFEGWAKECSCRFKRVDSPTDKYLGKNGRDTQLVAQLLYSLRGRLRESCRALRICKRPSIFSDWGHKARGLPVPTLALTRSSLIDAMLLMRASDGNYRNDRRCRRDRSISRILSDPVLTEVETGRGSHFSLRPTHPAARERVERAALPRQRRERDLFGLAPGGVCLVPRRPSPKRDPIRDLRHYCRSGGLLHHHFTFLPSPSPKATGCVFSVTLSVPAGSGPLDPWLTQGALPYGVRTFLLPSARGGREAAA